MLAKSSIDQVSLECRELARADRPHRPARRQGRAGRRDRRRDGRGRDARRRSAATIRAAPASSRRKSSSPARIAAWRRCGGRSPTRSSRPWRPARRSSGPSSRPDQLPRGSGSSSTTRLPNGSRMRAIRLRPSGEILWHREDGGAVGREGRGRGVDVVDEERQSLPNFDRFSDGTGHVDGQRPEADDREAAGQKQDPRGPVDALAGRLEAEGAAIPGRGLVRIVGEEDGRGPGQRRRRRRLRERAILEAEGRPRQRGDCRGDGRGGQNNGNGAFHRHRPGLHRPTRRLCAAAHMVEFDERRSSTLGVPFGKQPDARGGCTMQLFLPEAGDRSPQEAASQPPFLFSGSNRSSRLRPARELLDERKVGLCPLALRMHAIPARAASPASGESRKLRRGWAGRARSRGRSRARSRSRRRRGA